MLRFTVVGTPVAQPRPRMVKKTGAVYNPHDADHWKAQVKYATTQAVKDAIPSGGPHKSDHPFFLQLTFRLPRPASHWKKNGTPEIEKFECYFARGKQDADNLAKGVMDAMTQAIASPWTDDNVVVALLVIKCWTTKQPGVDASLVDLHGREREAFEVLASIADMIEVQF